MTEEEFIKMNKLNHYEVRLADDLTKEDLYEWNCQGCIDYYNKQRHDDRIYRLSAHFKQVSPPTETEYVSFTLSGGCSRSSYPGTMFINHKGLAKLKHAVSNYGGKRVLTIVKTEKIEEKVLN